MTHVHKVLKPAVDESVSRINGPDMPEAAGMPTDLAELKALIRTMLGQQALPTGTSWSMSNNSLSKRLTALDGDVDVRITAAVEAVLASVEAVLDHQSDAQAAALLALAQALQPGIAAAQQVAGAAQQTATSAQQTATAAQQTATGAQTTATKATADLAAFADRFRSRRVTTPAVGVGVSVPVLVSWIVPFADANYTVVTLAGGAQLLGLQVSLSAQNATGCTLTLKNAGLAALLAAAGSLHVLAWHD